MSRLISWAAASLEKSINQPMLPHIIIALNFTDTSIDEVLWESQQATDSLVSDFQRIMDNVDKFQEQARDWKDKGRPIHNVRELLNCYYSSVTVVRIPVKGRYMLINQQISRLRDQILSKCRDSHRDKRRARMISNSDDLQIYLSAAFKHFSLRLDVPFNFVEIALKAHPIPRNFSGNILQLAILIKDHPGISLPAMRIFEELGRFVAPCIFLDIVRQRLKSK